MNLLTDALHLSSCFRLSGKMLPLRCIEKCFRLPDQNPTRCIEKRFRGFLICFLKTTSGLPVDKHASIRL